MADVVFNIAALTALLEGPSGPVYKDLYRRGVLVETAAKQSMGGGYPPPSAPGDPPHLRSGRLRTSIALRPGADAIGPYMDVGSNVEYARFVEEGTPTMAARPYLRPALSAAAG